MSVIHDGDKAWLHMAQRSIAVAEATSDATRQRSVPVRRQRRRHPTKSAMLSFITAALTRTVTVRVCRSLLGKYVGALQQMRIRR